MNKKLIASLFIIISGETIFMLPFLIPRLFRPLMLEAWGLTNTDIGAAFTAYGLSAMASYLLGGPFADKYSPRLLICSSLLMTAVGSLFLILIPSKFVLISTYFFFGISTTFLMWGALIKVTHDFGDSGKKASAMGILDSGRGLVAAMMSSALILILGLFMSETEVVANKAYAVKIIYTITGIFTLLITLGVWLSLSNFETKESKNRDWSIDKAIRLAKRSEVWLLGIIILSSYCGYKNIDNYSIYLVDVKGLSVLKASSLTSLLFWARPVSALITGFVADKIESTFNQSRFIVLATLLLFGALSQFLVACDIFIEVNHVFSIILFTAIFAYALRAVYFAVFDDLKIPNNLLGTTVGIVSVVGFLPDMFFGAGTGYLIDTQAQRGFTLVFILTGSALVVGSIASIICHKKLKHR